MSDLSARAARLLSAPTVALSLSLVVVPIVLAEGADPQPTEVADAPLDGAADDEAASEETSAAGEVSGADDASGEEAVEPDEISDEESSETAEETSGGTEEGSEEETSEGADRESVEDGSGDLSVGESGDVSEDGSGPGVGESVEDGSGDLLAGESGEEAEEPDDERSGEVSEDVPDGESDDGAEESNDDPSGNGSDDESPGGSEQEPVDRTGADDDGAEDGSGDAAGEPEDGSEKRSGETSRSAGRADERTSQEDPGDVSGEESSDLDDEGSDGESGDRPGSTVDGSGGQGPTMSVGGPGGGSTGETSDVGEGVIRDETLGPSASEALSAESGTRRVPGGDIGRSAEGSAATSGPESGKEQSPSVVPDDPNVPGVASPSPVGAESEGASGGGPPTSGVDPVPTSAPAIHGAPSATGTSASAAGRGETGQVSPVAERVAPSTVGRSLPDREPVATPSPAPAAEPSASSTGVRTSPVEGPRQGSIVESSEVAQSAGVERRAVAVAESGSNTIDAGAPAVPGQGGRGRTSISTGNATVVGNDSLTNLSQQAVTTVGGRSYVEVVQIAITFNIGAALAITGLNSSATGGSTAADVLISTGNALAIGNDAESYLTQAGAAGAGDRDTATISQRTTLINISFSTANSGANIIITGGGAGSGGAIVSGNATAVGNRSTTGVDQRAVADAQGSSNISIEQTAVIVNLGVALANTGANRLGQAVRSLVLLSKGEVADDLFEILLPMLLDTARSGRTAMPGGGGVIETGDALAIGNRSHTESEQVAVAVAEQSGSVAITQEVFVANAGAATATTGANAVGWGLVGNAPRLDDEARAAIIALSGYLDGLLAQIELWRAGRASPLAGGDALALVDDIWIGVRIDLRSHEAMVTDPAGLVGLVRQLTAVIDIGLAVADSGGNTVRRAEPVPPIAGTASGGDATSRRTSAPTDASVVPLGTSAGDATSLETVSPLAAPTKVAARQFERVADNVVRRFGLEIRTGDASAANSSLTVICLRASLPGHECLAPEEVTQPGDPGHRAAAAADPAPTQGAPGADLAATGVSIYPMLLAAAAMLGCGLVLLAGSRRRATGADRRR